MMSTRTICIVLLIILHISTSLRLSFPSIRSLDTHRLLVPPVELDRLNRRKTKLHDTTVATSRYQSTSGSYSSDEILSLKFQILQLGSALDRGQSYNPTSGEYYAEKMQFAKSKINELIGKATSFPTTLSDMNGEWELALTTVPHGIFRSSPFFLAIQEAFHIAGEPDKALLFFKLHELQTCSWGASKVGRVAQIINGTQDELISEFDTSIFSLTVIPILGWFKLLPTFGGRVVTVSKAKYLEQDRSLSLEVDYTTSKPVKGLQGLGEFIWSIKVPVGAIWTLLPWNKGRKATATIKIRYCDDNFRVMEDLDGELFVYTRPAFVE